jgi:outer membrane protein assembly factor BamB
MFSNYPFRRSPSPMKRSCLVTMFLIAGAFHLSHASGPSSQANDFWPQWRGPLGTGAAPTAEPPLKWSETENVKWKVKIPGFGSSTPIIWGDRVFILTAIPTGKKAEGKASQAENESNPPEGRRGMRSEKPTEIHQFVVLCLDRRTGKTLWQKVAREELPHEGHHQTHGFASGSPVTDGQSLIAFFGSRGLHSYDLDGKLQWTKDFGKMVTKNSFGEGTSPALHGNTLIVTWDHEGDDFIVALDKRTGKELWRTARDEGTGWATPLIVQHGGKQQVVVNATGKVRSYDLATGKELWAISGQTVNAIPTPVATAETVYVMSGFRGSALHAIQLGKTGDLTGSQAIRWSHNKNTPYVPSPLLVDDLLYFVSNNDPKFSCFDADDGKPHFEAERLEGIFSVYASPVAAKDRVYVLGREGACVVVKKGPKLDILATNKVDDKTDASIALVGNELFLRGHQHLYCIAEK